MKAPRDRYKYSSPFTRPKLRLPGDGRIIVWSVVNIEEWELTRPMARMVSPPPMGTPAIPDVPNWTWHEYGMRVGIWRLLNAYKKFGVTPTLSLNASVCETCPEVAGAARDAGWEFMAHSYVQMPIHQIEDQRSVMKKSIATLEAFTGKRPRGWLGPGRTQTWHTLEFMVESGFTWFGDWILDDQPFWVATANGPILSIPYSVELNDITVMVSGQHESDAMLKRTVDAFDRLYEESADSTRVMAIAVHPYVTGASHRIKYFEKIYEYINGRRGVVHWTGEQIYSWYTAQNPAPGSRA
jgi:peptidoglycan/xylan/chitin deacetylase (PgdA/CDA1 family)